MRLLLVVSLLFIACAGHGQSPSLNGNLVSSAFQFTSTHGDVEWVIGEVVNETFSAEGYSLTNGLTGFFVLTATSDEALSTSVRSFPNPFKEDLTIEFPQGLAPDFDFQFYNSLGQQIDLPVKHREQNRIVFATSSMTTGVYVVTIANQKKIFKHLKLIRE